MVVQTITRQALLDKMTKVINNLPDDQLPQAEAQIDAWVAAVTDNDEQQELIIVPQRSDHLTHLRLPLRTTKPASVVMEVGEPYDTSGFTERLHANISWWNRHHAVLQQNPKLVGHYVAISDGEVFTADSYATAYAKACEVHGDAAPYIVFLKAPHELNRHAH